MMKRSLFLFAGCLSLAACGGEGTGNAGSESASAEATTEPNPNRNAYFGDLHVHTRYSFDAFIFGTVTDPNESYEFAKGGSIQHPGGRELKLDRPLDFQAVTDHGVYLGMLPAMTNPDSPAYQHPEAEQVRAAKTARERGARFQGMFPYLREEPGTEKHLNMDIVRGAWVQIVAAAERHNTPGEFTAFIGYEYTSGGGSNINLHRNVIFRGSEHPEAPFSRLDSSNPEDLWATMDRWRAEGIDALAIPHNSNGSGGRMFEMDYFAGGAIDSAYAETRMRNEPIVESTQAKGTSDTHPALSPNDEWAEFEIMPYKVATFEDSRREEQGILSQPPGSYVRDAYMRGLKIADGGVKNPYKFGLVGSSDTHVSAGSFEEDNHWSKLGLFDETPQLRGSTPAAEDYLTTTDLSPEALERTKDGSGRTYRDAVAHHWGASGLAGVWAEQNTRASLFDAMRRKETFATSGTRMRVRFFGGATLAGADFDDPEFLTKAYKDAVPMGHDYPAGEEGSPTFAVWALRDALAAPLQRVQIIKGWTSNGEAQERVFDVACSDGGSVDPATRRCPDNRATVDLATCEPSSDSGASELRTVWTDPEFDSEQRAFYYVRVLENPTCRWSTWDAIREGVEPRRDKPPTIQERAWSSPIWYNPR